jgi:hypothetical protein
LDDLADFHEMMAVSMENEKRAQVAAEAQRERR